MTTEERTRLIKKRELLERFMIEAAYMQWYELAEQLKRAKDAILYRLNEHEAEEILNSIKFDEQ